MDTSTYLGQVFGLLYTVIGIGIFINSELYLKLFQEMKQNTLLLYLSGCASLTVGLTMVTFHNIWEADWRGIITFIGWMALVKGVLLLLKPELLLQKAAFWQQRMMLAGSITLLLGLYLGYNGFAG